MKPALTTLAFAFFSVTLIKGADAGSDNTLSSSQHKTAFKAQHQIGKFDVYGDKLLDAPRPVPEPAAALLGAIGCFFLFRRR